MKELQKRSRAPVFGTQTASMLISGCIRNIVSKGDLNYYIYTIYNYGRTFIIRSIESSRRKVKKCSIHIHQIDDWTQTDFFIYTNTEKYQLIVFIFFFTRSFNTEE